MATLKVYNREYGVKTVEEKVKLNLFEKIGYVVCTGLVVFSSVYMLNSKGEIYSLENTKIKNEIKIAAKQKDNEEQKVIINNLSSYERIKNIAENLGLKTQKDNIKVVR